jgi:hypothetical protein
MNRLDHILWNVAEECAEVAQRASKAARFGLEERQEGQEFNNAERLMHEFADLEAAMDMLVEGGHVSIPVDYLDRIEAKKERFEKYLERSKLHGRYE